jgi:general secretion pathway protein H
MWPPGLLSRRHGSVVSSAPSIGRANGFSLVEMLVVLFVIGLLAAVVVLSMPGDERILRDEAERFAARTIAARDEAIVGGAPVALVVGPAGYYFQRRVDGAWLALPGKGFDLAAWKQGTQATVAQPGGRGPHRVRYAGACQRRWRGPAGTRGPPSGPAHRARWKGHARCGVTATARRRASPCSN